MDLEKIRKICCELRTGMQLNPFSLAAHGCSQLENFHSRILAALIDPHERSASSHSFLASFLSVLRQKAVVCKLEEVVKRLDLFCRAAEDVYVEVEYPVKSGNSNGRIDIAIVNDKNNEVIIVENKINGAPDMSRQVLRYVEGLSKEGYDVVAIVYLTAYNDVGHPDWTDWKRCERWSVEKLLIPISACKEGDKFSIVSWLQSACKGGNLSRQVVKQYSNFIDEFHDEAVKWNELCESVGDQVEAVKRSFADDLKTRRVLECLPYYIARRVLVEVSPGEFLKSILYRDGRTCCASFQRYYVKGSGWSRKAELGLDVDVVNQTITFFVRDFAAGNVSSEKFEKLRAFVSKVDPKFELVPRGGRCCRVQYVIRFKDVYGDVNALTQRISRIITRLSEEKDSIVKVLTR